MNNTKKFLSIVVITAAVFVNSSAVFAQGNLNTQGSTQGQVLGATTTTTTSTTVSVPTRTTPTTSLNTNTGNTNGASTTGTGTSTGNADSSNGNNNALLFGGIILVGLLAVGGAGYFIYANRDDKGSK